MIAYKDAVMKSCFGKHSDISTVYFITTFPLECLDESFLVRQRVQDRLVGRHPIHRANYWQRLG